MSGEWDGLRAAAEAALHVRCGFSDACTYAEHDPRRTWPCAEVDVSEVVDALAPLLDRLQAAEEAVERVRALLNGAPMTPQANVRRALDGPQAAATGEVALGSTGKPREPQIASQVCDHPGIDHDVVWSYCRRCPKCGVCKFIGHGPLCFDCYSASGAESDHGGRGDGEGLG